AGRSRLDCRLRRRRLQAYRLSNLGGQRVRLRPQPQGQLEARDCSKSPGAPAYALDLSDAGGGFGLPSSTGSLSGHASWDDRSPFTGPQVVEEATVWLGAGMAALTAGGREGLHT